MATEKNDKKLPEGAHETKSRTGNNSHFLARTAYRPRRQLFRHRRDQVPAHSGGMRHAHIGGIRISMEEGAGVDISFSDETYAEYGVRIVSREEALKCPVVLSYTPLPDSRHREK